MKARFGEFTLDTDLRQLRGPSGDLHLSPKTFDLLALLVQNRSRVLSKAELQERLWPDTFVVETNLASLIAEIRDALSDDARNPRFIRTAHRFGYAFCGAVVEAADQSLTSTSASQLCWLLQDGLRIPLRPGENILGRDDLEGTIRIDLPSVSRRHARIRVSGRDVTIEDLDSKNGTFVRGERLAGPAPLADGDELRLGSVAVTFRMTGGAGSTMTRTSTQDPAIDER
jgi:DNA-binding winged helix-turn-helix (wHTH) protein